MQIIWPCSKLLVHTWFAVLPRSNSLASVFVARRCAGAVVIGRAHVLADGLSMMRAGRGWQRPEGRINQCVCGKQDRGRRKDARIGMGIALYAAGCTNPREERQTVLLRTPTGHPWTTVHLLASWEGSASARFTLVSRGDRDADSDTLTPAPAHWPAVARPVPPTSSWLPLMPPAPLPTGPTASRSSSCTLHATTGGARRNDGAPSWSCSTASITQPKNMAER